MKKYHFSIPTNRWLTTLDEIVLQEYFGIDSISYQYTNRNRIKNSTAFTSIYNRDEYFVVTVTYASEITKFLLTNATDFTVKEMS